MKGITVIASTVSVASAGIPSDVICQSACGLVASSVDCGHSHAVGNFCSHLMRNDAGSFNFTQSMIAPERRLSINEASQRVIAPDNNCFAMYYEVPEMRQGATYCAENNVCPGLFWDMLSDAQPQYKLARDDAEYNAASPVLCDYERQEGPFEVEDHRGQVDPCKALCRLSFSTAQCDLVQRHRNQCIRLFWTDDSRTATAFSVRNPVGTQVPVGVAEARAKLLAPENNCEELCRRIPACAASLNKSNCREDNRTCQDLVYRPTRDLSTSPEVCLVGQAGCRHSDSPVLCQLPEDLIPAAPAAPSGRTSPGGKASTGVRTSAGASGTATTTPSNGVGAQGLMMTAVAILLTML